MMTEKSKYEAFSIEDFINDEYFQDWIINPDEEKNKFWMDFINTYPGKAEILEKAGKMLRSIGFVETWPADEKIENSLQNALVQIGVEQGRVVELYKASAKVKPLYGKWWAAAAIVLLILGAGSYFLFDKDSKKEIAKTGDKQYVIESDIAPGGNKAILTLADGTKLILDTTANGAITKQGSVTVIKLDGQLAYNKEGNVSKEVLYNTITTPKGGQYQLVLADGSKVWLNAASSIRFPTTFVGNERKVEITGEAYFEVAKDPSHPFRVLVNSQSAEGGMEVEVLGTHFNINGYNDENDIRTTLAEGKVKVIKSGSNMLLLPGQQAVADKSGRGLKLNHDVNTDQVLAWKNGLFDFDNESIQVIMRQLARWYDIETLYDGNIPDKHYTGVIPRSVTISKVLDMLELAGGVDLELKGKKIIIKRK